MVRQAFLEGRAAGQRCHVTHPVFRGGQFLDVVEHALGDAERPRGMSGGRHGHHSHPDRRRRSPVRLGGEQREGPVRGHEHVLDVIVVGAGSLEPLHMPAVVEDDLGARKDGHLHVGQALADPADLAVVHRQEAGRHVFGVTRARAETPRAAEPVTPLDGGALSVGEELAAHGDAVVVRGEHLGEAVVGQIGARGERRGQVRDADPSE